MRAETGALWTVGPLVAAAVLVGCGEARQSEHLYGNGRIEGDEVRVAAKVPGRIARLSTDEGERVTAGQTLVELALPEAEAQVHQARSAVAAAQAALVQGEVKVSVLEHHAATARSDHERMRALHDTGAASARQLDESSDALTEVEGELRVARAQVDQARANVAERQAALASARATAAEGTIAAPSDGLVLHRLVEPGEVVQPGQPLYVLVDPQRLHLAVYVAEDQIGKARAGAPATVTVDAFPERRFDGAVSSIADRAEFTPRDVHMPDERTRLVYRVEIRLDNPEEFLKPGMTADAEIHWRSQDES